MRTSAERASLDGAGHDARSAPCSPSNETQSPNYSPLRSPDLTRSMSRSCWSGRAILRTGDVACTVALQLAKARKLNPRTVAEQIVAHLRANPKSRDLIDDIAIAGPGFINLKISAAAQRHVVRAVLREQLRYGTTAAHVGERVLVEFVSANPTGRCIWATRARRRSAMRSPTC